MSEEALFDMPRSELEQALDVRLTVEGLDGLYLGNVLTAVTLYDADAVVRFLERLAAGEGTAVEMWAGEILVRELADDLPRAANERLWAELHNLDEGTVE